ncbi:hypothetical protein OG352_16705 [Streptomyces sp. NBC_01485]|uniref:hypothetical protein n=1 Tax=Streptomyces sp. NBC_01485 TaxID=2903884 RepID=UPI002E2F9419|nr:hypothetical protein [Streptomyces sp. NBC_01485]
MDVPRENGLLSAPKSSNGLSENERSSDLRDPWGEEPGGADGKGNDPGEVTVQLDPLKKGRPDGPEAGASDVPVFVDESGRRSRTFRRIGIFVGTACGAYAVLIVATLLSGNAGAPWLPVPVPGAPDDKPAAGKVDSSSAPDDSTTPRPGEPGGLFPGGSGSTASGFGTMPGKPGASAVPGASGSAAASPGASMPARPSASGTARPSTAPTAAVSPSPGPSSPVIAPTASTPPPAASSPAATPEPPASSPSPAGGTTTVANGPPDPAPAASSPVPAA